MFSVTYTSTERQSQIYIGFVNWFLLLAVLFIIAIFQQSKNLAAAYGLAVTGDMAITGTFMTFIFWLQHKRGRALIAAVITVVDFAYFLSNINKIPHGGYWSIIIAAIPLTMIIVYLEGQKKLYASCARCHWTFSWSRSSSSTPR